MVPFYENYGIKDVETFKNIVRLWNTENTEYTMSDIDYYEEQFYTDFIIMLNPTECIMTSVEDKDGKFQCPKIMSLSDAIIKLYKEIRPSNNEAFIVSAEDYCRGRITPFNSIREMKTALIAIDEVEFDKDTIVVEMNSDKRSCIRLSLDNDKNIIAEFNDDKGNLVLKENQYTDELICGLSLDNLLLNC